MEQLINLAKGVIVVALRDLILNTPGNGFKHQGTPYIDDNDNILFSNIKKEMINIEIVKWFESDSREQYSFLYWNDYAGLNPNCITAYIKKLRLILNGERLEDEKEIEIVRYAEPEPHYIAKGYLPYGRMNYHGKKWVNV